MSIDSFYDFFRLFIALIAITAYFYLVVPVLKNIFKDIFKIIRLWKKSK